MFEVDPRFFNEDGSIDYEAALTAGRDARAAATKDALMALRRAVVRLVRGTGKSSADPVVPRRAAAPVVPAGKQA